MKRRGFLSALAGLALLPRLPEPTFPGAWSDDSYDALGCFVWGASPRVLTEQLMINAIDSIRREANERAVLPLNPRMLRHYLADLSE